MPCYDWNGTTLSELKDPSDWNGTTSSYAKEIGDWNGTAYSKLWTSEPEFFNGGSKVTWSQYTLDNSDSVSIGSTLYGKSNNAVSLIVFWTQSKVNMTPLKKIIFNYTATSNHYNGSVLCGITDKTGSAVNNFYDPKPYVKYANAKVGQVEIDVSTITGSYYIAISLVNSTGHGTTFTVNKVIATE